MKFAAAMLLAVLPSSALAETSLSMLMQGDAPVQLQSTTHGLSDALEAAVFKNRSAKAITAYRIGWASVVGGKTEFHHCVWMNRPGGIAAGTDETVPAQGIPLDLKAQKMRFFVASVTFADGTHWKARKADLLRQTVQDR